MPHLQDASVLRRATSVSVHLLAVQDRDSEVWERRGCLGSLQSFDRLERLELPILVLLSWDTMKEDTLSIQNFQALLCDGLPPRFREK